jgi:hypothetical protein
MPVIDMKVIGESVSEDTRRLRVLGISKERESEYYNSLSVDSCDPGRDERVFRALVVPLSLSETDQGFVKRVLDDRDPR